MSEFEPDWSVLTPEHVSTLMTFVENDKTWKYSTNKTSMAAKQAEGVAYLCQLLERKGLALLADEVGIGESFPSTGHCKIIAASEARCQGINHCS